MKKCKYVIDTSYLVEFYKVSKHCKPKNHEEITKRYKEAINKRPSVRLIAWL
ncbi:hypothetical protein MHK_005007 [Candidatus Magnetomorum sp. HK-1]|nr:hypothetical protein MHK_005007 [Candidatus Magnetomorum sp. HK-1]